MPGWFSGRLGCPVLGTSARWLRVARLGSVFPVYWSRASTPNQRKKDPSLDRPRDGSLTRYPTKTAPDYGVTRLIPRYRPTAEGMRNHAAGGKFTDPGVKIRL